MQIMLIVSTSIKVIAFKSCASTSDFGLTTFSMTTMPMVIMLVLITRWGAEPEQQTLQHGMIARPLDTAAERPSSQEGTPWCHAACNCQIIASKSHSG